MGFILPAIAAALANRVIGGKQQQPQPQAFQFQKGPRLPMAPISGGVALRGASAADARLVDSPILAAYSAAAPAEAPKAPAKEKEGANFKDTFLQSLTQGLVQRMLFGSGQQQFQYAPPTFR